jgi:UDP-N-acetylmuramyl tripeptide synthase
VISGAVAVRLDPALLATLSASRRVAVVTGTNGKTTTTWMLADAVRTQAAVATNREGSNLEAGLATALLDEPESDHAVLEVDEIYLPLLAPSLRPEVVVLLNLSREFTRGVSLGRTVRALRRMLAGLDWPCTVVANADDPLVVWVVQAAAPIVTVVWVAGGLTWGEDCRRCPSCGAGLDLGERWRCPTADLVRPAPHWWREGEAVVGPAGRVPVAPIGPGQWLWSNALFAVAAAAQLGVPLPAAAAAVGAVVDVDGRYRLVSRGDHDVRLFMVKNPASWSQALGLASAPGHLVLVLERFGIKDATPLWDVDIDPHALGRVTVAGHRHADLAMRLEAAGATFDVVADPLAAIDAAPPGPVNVVVNYTALGALKKALES